MGVLAPTRRRGALGRPADHRGSTGAQFGYMPEERGLYPKQPVLDQLVYLGRLRGHERRGGPRRGDEPPRAARPRPTAPRTTSRSSRSATSSGCRSSPPLMGQPRRARARRAVQRPRPGRRRLRWPTCCASTPRAACRSSSPPTSSTSSSGSATASSCWPAAAVVAAGHGRRPARRARCRATGSSSSATPGWVRDVRGIHVVDVDGTGALLEVVEHGAERRLLERGAAARRGARVRPQRPEPGRDLPGGDGMTTDPRPSAPSRRRRRRGPDRADDRAAAAAPGPIVALREIVVRADEPHLPRLDRCSRCSSSPASRAFSVVAGNRTTTYTVAVTASRRAAARRARRSRRRAGRRQGRHRVDARVGRAGGPRRRRRREADAWLHQTGSGWTLTSADDVPTSPCATAVETARARHAPSTRNAAAAGTTVAGPRAGHHADDDRFDGQADNSGFVKGATVRLRPALLHGRDDVRPADRGQRRRGEAVAPRRDPRHGDPAAAAARRQGRSATRSSPWARWCSSRRSGLVAVSFTDVVDAAADPVDGRRVVRRSSSPSASSPSPASAPSPARSPHAPRTSSRRRRR